MSARRCSYCTRNFTASTFVCTIVKNSKSEKRKQQSLYFTAPESRCRIKKKKYLKNSHLRLRCCCSTMTSSPTSPSSLWRRCQLPTGAASATSPTTSSAGNSRFGGAGRSWSSWPARNSGRFEKLQSWKNSVKFAASLCDLCARDAIRSFSLARFYFLTSLASLEFRASRSTLRLGCKFLFVCAHCCFDVLMMLFWNMVFKCC